VNIEALDFARGRSLGDRGGYTGFAVPCRDDRACVIALDQDDAGHQSNTRLTNELDVFVANDTDGMAVWGALLELRDLYPEQPVIGVR
jgi:hypothetical protein